MIKLSIVNATNIDHAHNFLIVAGNEGAVLCAVSPAQELW